MNRHVDIDEDRFEHVSAPTNSIMLNLERDWDGKTINMRGSIRGIPLADYHGKRDLFDGPSISKSSLKWLLPTHGGSPKAFWGRWKWNPNHVEPKSSDALDFGRAVHCLLLGDEPFDASFAVRPDQFKDYKTAAAREWRDGTIAAGKTPITPEQIERIRRIRADASQHPLVKGGCLNGEIERTICCKDKETGIWLKARPDAWSGDGFFTDLKTTSSLAEDFLAKQSDENGYFLQAALTRMVCRAIGVPFHTFMLVYVLNDDVPDTAHVEISADEIDRAERAIRWCLRTIRECLDKNEWPGVRPFADGTLPLRMKVWAKDRLEQFLQYEERAAA